jgi:proline iminopeptidase
MRVRFLLAACAAAAACVVAETTDPDLVPGEAKLAVDGGSIWYKVSGAGAGTPLVLLHGGPGFSSFYLKPFEDLSDDRIVIRYDQLGSGKSDATTDTTRFTVEHFVRELDSLRAHLGIERLHVLGHSWGSMLAMAYYEGHAEHVASLTLGSPVFKSTDFAAYARTLVKTLTDSSQRAIARAEAAGKFDDPSYQNAINEFYGLYVFRRPPAADLDSSMTTFSQAVYGYMWGPSEFTMTGTLSTFDVLSKLPAVGVPTLLTVGEFDEVEPAAVHRAAGMIPGAEIVVLGGSAHVTTWDARDDNVRAVRAFLRRVDSATTSRY